MAKGGRYSTLDSTPTRSTPGCDAGQRGAARYNRWRNATTIPTRDRRPAVALRSRSRKAARASCRADTASWTRFYRCRDPGVVAVWFSLREPGPVRNYGCGAVLWFNGFLPTTGKAKTGATSKTPAASFLGVLDQWIGRPVRRPEPGRFAQDSGPLLQFGPALSGSLDARPHCAEGARDCRAQGPTSSASCLVDANGAHHQRPTNPIRDCHQVSRNVDSRGHVSGAGPPNAVTSRNSGR